MSLLGSLLTGGNSVPTVAQDLPQKQGLGARLLGKLKQSPENPLFLMGLGVASGDAQGGARNALAARQMKQSQAMEAAKFNQMMQYRVAKLAQDRQKAMDDIDRMVNLFEGTEEEKIKYEKELRATAFSRPDEQLNISQQNADAATANANKKTGPSVVINQPDGDELGKAIARKQGDLYGGLQDRASSARDQLNQISLFRSILDGGVPTGSLQQYMLPLKQLGTSFGLDLEGVPAQETIQALSNQMALVLRNPDSGMGLTGNTSNADRNFLVQSVAGLGKTEESNYLLLGIHEAIQNRKILEAQLADNYYSDHGNLSGFVSYMSKYNQENPVFDDELVSLVNNAAGKQNKSKSVSYTEEEKAKAFEKFGIE